LAIVNPSRRKHRRKHAQPDGGVPDAINAKCNSKAFSKLVRANGEEICAFFRHNMVGKKNGLANPCARRLVAV